MSWAAIYLPEVSKDLRTIDRGPRAIVRAAIEKVSKNPLPKTENGYGIPLGNHNTANLTGALEIKLRDLGIRVVYTLERKDNVMLIIVVGMRADDSVYKIAAQRIKKHGL